MQENSAKCDKKLFHSWNKIGYCIIFWCVVKDN